MTRRTFIVVFGVALVAVLATGGLIASNMGFKLNFLLEAAGGSSASGTNTIALPFNQQAGINNTGDLGNDIGGFSGAGGPVLEVQKFLRNSDSFSVYSGGKGTTADPIVAGEGYRVRVNANTNYIIAGSHNPGLAIDLYAAGDVTPDGVSASGTNEFAVPYHTTAANSGDIGNDIGGFSGSGGPVLEVQTFLRASDSFSVYSGGKGTTADPITPGTSIRVRVNATQSYIPSHY